MTSSVARAVRRREGTVPVALVTASFVARVGGYPMAGDWGEADAATNAAFRPLEDFPVRIGEILAEAGGAGFDTVEVWSAHLHPSWAGSAHVDAARRAANAHGVRFLGLGGELGRTAAELDRTCALVRALGGTLLVGQTPLLAADRRATCDVLRRHGVRLAVENEGLSPEEVLTLVGTDSGGLLGAAVDTASFLESGHDPVAATRALAGVTSHIHLRNVTRADAPEAAPFGEGAVDVEACLAAALMSPGDVSVGIEIFAERRDPTAGLRHDRALVRRWLAP